VQCTFERISEMQPFVLWGKLTKGPKELHHTNSSSCRALVSRWFHSVLPVALGNYVERDGWCAPSFSSAHVSGTPVTPGGDDSIRIDVITRTRPDGGSEKVRCHFHHVLVFGCIDRPRHCGGGESKFYPAIPG
jgi:hypothetical protein